MSAHSHCHHCRRRTEPKSPDFRTAAAAAPEYTCQTIRSGNLNSHIELAAVVDSQIELAAASRFTDIRLPIHRPQPPPEIPQLNSLPNLQTLVLRSNSFSGTIPPSIASLKSLDTVYLSSNFLTGKLPPALGGMVGLRRLDPSFNKLTGELPKLPRNLIQLAAKANSLSRSVSKPAFEGLTQLEVVEIGDNFFSGTLPAWFFLLLAHRYNEIANSGDRAETTNCSDFATEERERKIRKLQ